MSRNCAKCSMWHFLEQQEKLLFTIRMEIKLVSVDSKNKVRIVKLY